MGETGCHEHLRQGNLQSHLSSRHGLSLEHTDTEVFVKSLSSLPQASSSMSLPPIPEGAQRPDEVLLAGRLRPSQQIQTGPLPSHPVSLWHRPASPETAIDYDRLGSAKCSKTLLGASASAVAELDLYTVQRAPPRPPPIIDGSAYLSRPVPLPLPGQPPVLELDSPPDITGFPSFRSQFNYYLSKGLVDGSGQFPDDEAATEDGKDVE